MTKPLYRELSGYDRCTTSWPPDRNGAIKPFVAALLYSRFVYSRESRLFWPLVFGLVLPLREFPEFTWQGVV